MEGQTVTTDTTAPLPPSTIAASPISSTQILLSWSGASDNVGVAGYKVFRNGAYMIGVTTTTFTDSNVSPSTPYSYYVKVVDAAGNESSSSATITATTSAITTTSTETGDTTAPVISGVEATNIMGPGAQIIWTTDDASDSSVAYGIIPSEGHTYPSFTNWTCGYSGYVTSHCINLTNLSLGTKYYYRVFSKNSAGREGISSEYTFVAASSTTQTPSQPTSTPLPVSISVSRGTSFYEGSIGKTSVIFGATPATSAYFRLTTKTESGSSTAAEVKPGTYAFPNSSYY
jgi:chitodextrinase